MSSVQEKVIKHKIGLLNLAAELGNVLTWFTETGVSGFT